MEGGMTERGLWVLRARFALLFAVYGFLAGTAAAFSPGAAGVLLALGLGAYTYCFLFYLPHRQRAHRFSLHTGRLEVERGVFFHRRLQLELSRVQYAGLWITPLQKKMGLCTLVFHTAGGPVRLESIPLRAAARLRRQLPAARL